MQLSVKVWKHLIFVRLDVVLSKTLENAQKFNTFGWHIKEIILKNIIFQWTNQIGSEISYEINNKFILLALQPYNSPSV